MSKKSPTYLIGDLLVRSELLSRQVVADAIPISLSTRLPLGSVLVSSGHLDEQTVQALVLAQSLIRDKFLSEELAADALKLAHTAGLGLKEALKQLGWKTETFELTNRLGQFFLDAEIITAEQLAKGLASFGSSGLPLARSLVLDGVISSALAFSALSAQKLVRDEIIEREQAIEALKSAAKNGISIETSLSYYESIHIEPLNRIRLGEILVLSNLISESELLEMVERSIVNEELIGETFVKAGLITYSQLKDALHLQQLFNQGKLTIGQITDVMRRILASGMTVDEAIELVTAPSILTAQLSGPTAEFVINKNELQPAIHSSPVYETADDSAYISVAEAAKSLDVDLAKIAKLVKAKEIDYFQRDGLLFVNISQLIFQLTDPTRQDLQEVQTEQFFENVEQEQSFKKKKQKSRNVQIRSKAKYGKRKIVIKRPQSLLEKLIERVEKLSYEKGYLEGQLALRLHEYAPTINTTESSVTNSAEPEAESTPQAESVMVEELAIDSITESTTPEGDFAISEYIHGQMTVVTDEEQKHDSQSQHDSAEESTGDETAEPSDNSEKELVTAKASSQSKTAHNSKRKKRRR